MARLDHFTMQRRTAEYAFPAADPARQCGGCRHLEDVPRAERCRKGGFFVGKRGTCKHFEPPLVQIGPTDI